ncbi:MAG TPA: hypothetical protein VK465_05650 [Fibrobacteria bacterium]|nr:hypothetical protein [Fibrobacteria bacterium]
MMRTVMESAGLVFWPMLSLILFTLFATATTLWLWRRGSRGFYEDMAKLALGGSGNNDSVDGRG